jgi:hypothetical protein
MFEDTFMKNTDLILSLVSATSISYAQQRQMERDAECMCCLDQGQPDWVFVSHALKKIAIVDLCRPSDVHPGQLKAASKRKQDGYTTLVSQLCNYKHKRWTVHVFPWVVGISGLIDPSLIVSLLTLLEIPSKHHKAAVEHTILASVKALYFMHQVRFGRMHGRKQATGNQQNSSDSEVTDDEELRTDPSGRRRNWLAQAAGRT